MKLNKNRLGNIQKILESRLLLAGAALPANADASQAPTNLPDQDGLENVTSTDSVIDSTALPTAVAEAETPLDTNVEAPVANDSQRADFSAATARDIGDALSEELPRADFVFEQAMQLANQFTLARDAVQEGGLDSVFASGTDARSGLEFSLLQSERFIAESSLLTQGTLESLDAAGQSFGLSPVQFSQDEPVDLTLPVPVADDVAGDDVAGDDAASADLPPAASGLGTQTNDETPVELAATESVDAEAVLSADDTLSPLPTEVASIDNAVTSGPSDQTTAVPTENLPTGVPVAEPIAEPVGAQFASDLAATDSVDTEAVLSADDTLAPLPTELAADAEPAVVAASESPLSFESIDDDFQTATNAIANSNLVFTNWAQEIGLTVQSLLNFDPSVGDAGQADALFETFTTQLDAFPNVISAANEDFGVASDVAFDLSQAVAPLDFENPIPLDLDSDLNGQIDGALGQQANVFSVEIPVADEFTFFAESDDFDPVLTLFDENETAIFENDDLDPTDAERADQEFSEINSRIVTPLEPGNLFATVEGFSNTDVGDFRLSVGPNAAGLPITAAIGDSDPADLDSVGDVDSLAAVPSDDALIGEEALQVDPLAEGETVTATETLETGVPATGAAEPEGATRENSRLNLEDDPSAGPATALPLVDTDLG